MAVLQSNMQATDILKLIDEEYGESEYGSGTGHRHNPGSKGTCR